MASNAKKLLRLSKSRVNGEREILKSLRSQVKTDPDNVMELSKAALILIKQCDKDMIGLKLVDEIFNDMIEGSTFSSEEQKLGLLMKGFKPISHKGIFHILKKRYGKTEGSEFETNECLVVMTHVTLPNDRSGLPHKFPPLKMKILSTVNHLQFEIFGESSVLFALFCLKTILQSYLKQLPEKIEHCYKSPTNRDDDNLVTSEESIEDTDSTSQDTMSSEGGKSPSPIFHSRQKSATTPAKPVGELFKELEMSPSPPPSIDSPVKYMLTPTQSPARPSVPTPTLSLSSPSISPPQVPRTPAIATSPSAIPTTDNKKTKMNKEVAIAECLECALNRISNSIESIAKQKVVLCFECSLQCFDLPDPILTFSTNLYKIICRTEILQFDSMQIFKDNLGNIIRSVVSKLEGGAPVLFCKLMQFFSYGTHVDKDRLASVSRTVLGFCCTEEFGDVFIRDRQARRKIFGYLGQTGSFFAFMCITECLYLMFTKGLDMQKVLPSNLQFIIDMFREVQSISDDLEYHDFVSEVSRSIIQTVYKNELIDFYEITKKTFKLGNETLEIVSDNMVYIDKLNSRLFHFLYLGDSYYSEPIPTNSLIFSEDLKQVSSNRWTFSFENDTIFQRWKIQNSKKDENVQEKADENADELYNDDAQSDSGDGEPDSDYKPLQTVEGGFTIARDDVMKYWDRRPNVKRKFLPGISGKNWPKMYNSPCVVVLGYNRVQEPDSQKRSCNFARIKGTCKVCKSLHLYAVVENPFHEEIMEDDTIKYTPIKDCVFSVTVIGRFHDKADGPPGEPDISNPVHDVKKSTGYHLKGKERELLAKRATKIGIKATYLEQLDFANEGELKQVITNIFSLFSLMLSYFRVIQQVSDPSLLSRWPGESRKRRRKEEKHFMNQY